MITNLQLEKEPENEEGTDALSSRFLVNFM